MSQSTLIIMGGDKVQDSNKTSKKKKIASKASGEGMDPTRLRSRQWFNNPDNPKPRRSNQRPNRLGKPLV